MWTHARSQGTTRPPVCGGLSLHTHLSPHGPHPCQPQPSCVVPSPRPACVETAPVLGAQPPASSRNLLVQLECLHSCPLSIAPCPHARSWARTCTHAPPPHTHTLSLHPQLRCPFPHHDAPVGLVKVAVNNLNAVAPRGREQRLQLSLDVHVTVPGTAPTRRPHGSCSLLHKPLSFTFQHPLSAVPSPRNETSLCSCLTPPCLPCAGMKPTFLAWT